MSFCVRCFDNDTDEPKDLRKVLRLLVLSLCDNAGSSSLVAAFRTQQQSSQQSAADPSADHRKGSFSSSLPKGLPMTPPRPGSSSHAHSNNNRWTTVTRRPRRLPPSLGTLQHVLIRTFQSPIESIPLGVAQPTASNSSSTNSSMAGVPPSSSSLSASPSPQAHRKKWVRLTDVGRIGRKTLRRLAAYYAPATTSAAAAIEEADWTPELDPEAQELLKALRECQGLIVVVDSTVPLMSDSSEGSRMDQAVPCNGERFFSDYDAQRLGQQEQLAALLSLLHHLPPPLSANSSSASNMSKSGKKKQLLRDEQHQSAAARGEASAERRPVPPLFVVANKQDQPSAVRLPEMVNALGLSTAEGATNSLKGVVGRWTCQPASVLLHPHRIMTRITRFFAFGLGAIASSDVGSVPVSPGGLSDSTTSRRRAAPQRSISDTHSGTDICPPPLSFRAAVLSDDERSVTTATNSTTSTVRAARFASLLAPPAPSHQERGGGGGTRRDTAAPAPPQSRSPSTLSRSSDGTDKPLETEEVPLRSSSHSAVHRDPLKDPTMAGHSPDKPCESTSEQRSLLGREGSGATLIKHSVQRALASKLKMSPTTAPLDSPVGGQYEQI